MFSNIFWALIIALPFYYFGYQIYAKFIASVFEESDNNKTPAVRINDGVDYVPTNPVVVFSHHFSAIAAAGPIIGPTVALIFGFAPAWLWIVIGAVVAGGVHDFTAMLTSCREDGRSIAEIAKRTIGKSAYLLFVGFAIVALIMVCSVFLRLTATALTSLAPINILGIDPQNTIFKIKDADGILKAQVGGIASTSVIIITLFAPIIGWLIYKRKFNIYLAAIISLLICFLSVWIGFFYPISFDPNVWMVLIAIYTFFAAGLPVWLVLQPRDFINSFFLFFGILAMVAGGIIVGLKGGQFNFPAFNIAVGQEKLGPIWPILFITIACGACSGFHSIVATGTSCKQISKESHARKIGYGAMLVESILALGVLIAVGFGLKYHDYLAFVFPVQKINENPVLGYALGLAELLKSSFNFPRSLGVVFGILLVEGFLVTTLDAAVRLTRYLFEELWATLFKSPLKILKNYYFNSLIIVLLMLFLGYTNAFSSIWPIFGSANQLLAGLAFITISAWLLKRNKPYWFTLIPALFMLATTIYSLIYLLFNKYFPAQNYPLITADLILLVLSCGMIFLSFRLFFKSNKLLRT
jgi:carbon starvation protein